MGTAGCVCATSAAAPTAGKEGACEIQKSASRCMQPAKKTLRTPLFITRLFHLCRASRLVSPPRPFSTSPLPRG